MKKQKKHIGAWILLLGSTMLICGFLLIILYHLFSQGFPVLSWEFIFGNPTDGMTKGGIFPAIVGTILVTLISTFFAVPFGVCCAVYLNEYAGESVLTGIIRACIRNLAGIPSIIYGLFGLALFVQAMGLGTSVLSAGLTLGLLSLPYIITTTEEALKRVPNSTREAALGLGATQFESLRDFVIPQAMPGIITGIVLTIARVAGETAPILFTGVAFFITGIPGSMEHEFMALPYHLYMLSTQHQSIETVRPLAYGTVTVLILIILLMNLLAFYIRYKFREND
jgi:phosphate transport system permease protein